MLLWAQIFYRMVLGLRQGDILTLEITGINSEGEGIARHGGEGFVVFVRGALPGERVKCRVTKAAKKYATAETLDIFDAADVRVTPRCRHYYKCGGCQLQHASYGAQTAIKSKILTDALRRIAKIELPKKIICEPSPEAWGYRNKTALPVQRGGRGKDFVCGYYMQGSHNIVPYGECPVLNNSLGRVVPRVIEALSASGLKGYDEKSRTGDVRYIAARSGGDCDDADNEVLSCVVSSHEFAKREIGRLKNIHQKLGVELPELVGSVLNVNPDQGNFIWGPMFRSLNGKKFLQQRLGDYTFQTDISAFFQINRAQTERMFAHVRERAKGAGANRMLELYSGVGSLTAYLSGIAESVVAVEEWRPSVRQMAENMERNGIGNVEIHEDSAEKFMTDEDMAKRGAYDTIVLDPPRTGCPEPVIEGIKRIEPETVVYVSCNPATLARDISRLMESGYSAADVKAFDMFPQTAHVESVCLLTKK